MSLFLICACSRQYNARDHVGKYGRAHRYEDAGYIGVETVRVVVAVLDHETLLCGFERAGDVRVDPEGPEGVVEVEDHHLG